MESQLDRQPGHHYDGVPPAGVNSGIQDEVDQQPHEKKSVFRKVKDKAKKLKNSMTKHGNGSQDDDEDEDDDETITKNEDPDEMDVDPAVHASSADVARPGLHSEKPTAIGEDPYSIQKTEPTSRSGEEINGLPLPVIPEKRVSDPTSVKDEGIKQEGVKFGDPEDLEDAQDPRGGSNYQTKAIDHTGKGGQEADVASLIQSFEKTGLHGNSSAHSGLHGVSGVHGDSGIPGGVHGDSDSGVSGGVNGESGILGVVHGDSGDHDESAPKIAELRESFGNIGVHDAPVSTGSHDQFPPESFSFDKTANPTDSHDQFPLESLSAYKSASPTGSHDQFPSESFPTYKTANPMGVHDQFPSESFSADKAANPTDSHDHFPPESFSTDKAANPTDSHDQFPPESFSTDKTANPTSSHDQFPSESFSTAKTANPTESFPRSSDHIKPEHLHHDTTEPKPSGQGSYIGMITSAVPSVITGTAISAKNVVASKLGYGPTKDAAEAPRTTDDIAGATKPASITDKAISAKNVVASKLGYGGTDAPRTEEIAGATKPVSALETGQVEESAKPASITDKVISAKNTVASKLGYGGTKETEAPSTEHIAGATKPVSGLETGEVQGTTKPASSPTYVQGMTAKVTETLAPVYAKAADTGSSVISRVTGAGTGGKEGAAVPGDDKGTSVKEYLYGKFKPGEEEKALSREISDALHIRKENPSTKTEKEPRTLGKVVDATGEEPRVLAEAKKEGDDVSVVGPEKVNKGVVDYVKDTVSSWVGKGGQEQQQQHTQGSSDSHAAGTAVPLPGETGHPQSVSEDKKMG
jgi:hypothetical protein